MIVESFIRSGDTAQEPFEFGQEHTKKFFVCHFDIDVIIEKCIVLCGLGETLKVFAQMLGRKVLPKRKRTK